MRVFLSSSPEKLAAIRPHATVEAEYGDTCVGGTLVTLAHHGSRADRPCPCIDPTADGIALPDNAIIGVSHLDADTLGGLILVMRLHKGAPLAALGRVRAFFGLIARMDVGGWHQLDRGHDLFPALAGLEAWLEDNAPPRSDEPVDITGTVLAATDIVWRALLNDEQVLAMGRDFLERESALNKASYCESREGVIKRIAGGFTNHLYRDPAGNPANAVVALNTDQKSVTVSFAAPIPGVSARDIVQGLWGPEAGGHAGIAGSPRNRVMGEKDLHDAFMAVVKILEKK